MEVHWWPTCGFAGSESGRLLQSNLLTTKNVAEASKGCGVKSFVYLSFPGADARSQNEYIRTKGQAEDVIEENFGSGAIFRVPMILGTDTPAMNQIKRLLRSSTIPRAGRRGADNDILGRRSSAVEGDSSLDCATYAGELWGRTPSSTANSQFARRRLANAPHLDSAGAGRLASGYQPPSPSPMSAPDSTYIHELSVQR